MLFVAVLRLRLAHASNDSRIGDHQDGKFTHEVNRHDVQVRGRLHRKRLIVAHDSVTCVSLDYDRAAIKHDLDEIGNIIDPGACCCFRDEPIKFQTTTARRDSFLTETFW